jgi:hypothetical protein
VKKMLVVLSCAALVACSSANAAHTKVPDRSTTAAQVIAQADATSTPDAKVTFEPSPLPSGITPDVTYTYFFSNLPGQPCDPQTFAGTLDDVLARLTTAEQHQQTFRPATIIIGWQSNFSNLVQLAYDC